MPDPHSVDKGKGQSSSRWHLAVILHIEQITVQVTRAVVWLSERTSIVKRPAICRKQVSPVSHVAVSLHCTCSEMDTKFGSPPLACRA